MTIEAGFLRDEGPVETIICRDECSPCSPIHSPAKIHNQPIQGSDHLIFFIYLSVRSKKLNSCLYVVVWNAVSKLTPRSLDTTLVEKFWFTPSLIFIFTSPYFNIFFRIYPKGVEKASRLLLLYLDVWVIAMQSEVCAEGCFFAFNRWRREASPCSP